MLSKLRKCARGNAVVYNSNNQCSKRKGMKLNKHDRNVVSTRCLFSIQTRIIEVISSSETVLRWNVDVAEVMKESGETDVEEIPRTTLSKNSDLDCWV